MEQTFLSVFILILLVTNPIGNIPNFIGVLQRVPAGKRRRVVLREVAIAYVILLGFMFFGDRVLGWLHLTQTSLGIAGGVILFLIALRMVFPGEANSLAAMLVSAVVLSFADPIRKLLGERATAAAERLMGLILTAIAVEMLLSGIRSFGRSL